MISEDKEGCKGRRVGLAVIATSIKSVSCLRILSLLRFVLPH